MLHVGFRGKSWRQMYHFFSYMNTLIWDVFSFRRDKKKHLYTEKDKLEGQRVE